jgi:flagellar assembly factor FliW
MQLTTYRYGQEEQVDVPSGDVFEFDPGPNGFEQERRFALLAGGDSPVEWLQSVDTPRLTFATLEPFLFYPDYGFELSDRDCEELRLRSPEDAMVRCILTLRESADQITANLLAPIVLNRYAGRARQVILQDSNLSLRFPVFEALQLPLSA